MGRSFQPVQGGIASSTEGGAARLTPQRLDPLSTPMFAISDDGMEGSVGVAEVHALRVGTGEAFGRNASGGLPAGFSPHTGDAQALALHSTRQGRRDDRRGNRLGCGASSDAGACCAWLLSSGQDHDGASTGNTAAPQSTGGHTRAEARTSDASFGSSRGEM